MHSYEFTVCLLPSGRFGLPDEGWQIIEARSGNIYSDTIDSRTGNIVEFGTLSRYRDYEDRLTVSFELGDSLIAFSDNRMTMQFMSENGEIATATYKQKVRRLVPYLSTELGFYISFEFMQAMEDGTPIPIPHRFTLQRVHMFNLQQLGQQILKAGTELHGVPFDSQLDQSLRYYAEAGELHEMMSTREYLAPQCFLQFWKALATIAGDPSKDQDHQVRCKRYGLDKQYFEENVKPLHDIRNRFDVAHIASLDAPLFVVQSDVQRCKSVAGTLIRAYTAYLHRHAAPQTTPEELIDS